MRQDMTQTGCGAAQYISTMNHWRALVRLRRVQQRYEQVA